MSICLSTTILPSATGMLVIIITIIVTVIITTAITIFSTTMLIIN